MGCSWSVGGVEAMLGGLRLVVWPAYCRPRRSGPVVVTYMQFFDIRAFEIIGLDGRTHLGKSRFDPAQV